MRLQEPCSWSRQAKETDGDPPPIEDTEVEVTVYAWSIVYDSVLREQLSALGLFSLEVHGAEFLLRFRLGGSPEEVQQAIFEAVMGIEGCHLSTSPCFAEACLVTVDLAVDVVDVDLPGTRRATAFSTCSTSLASSAS